MKKIITLLVVLVTFGFQGCTGPEGPQGPPGYTVEAEVFEVTASFSNANNFSKIVILNPPIFNSDMILVYHLFDVVNGEDLWRLMPQTVYLPEGELDYNYDFTRNDINIFLNADFDLNVLSANWTKDQIFRVVIIPGYFANSGNRMDFSDYKTVVNEFHINESDIKKKL
jgi:hypothetical protein